MTHESEYGWYHPRLCGGEIHGLNDPGVETFKGRNSLGREILQNIIDATLELPPIAEFELLSIPPSQIPGHEDLLRVFQACHEYIEWRSKSEDDRRANGLAFFAKGIETLSSDAVHVLRIRDRNTKGLVGKDDDPDSPWSRLIRAQGFSRSEGAGGGTKGIGQRAPFAFSGLQTIMYYTRLPTGEEAFVTKSVLCSFPHYVDGEMTQRTGWYCKLPPSERSYNWTGIRDPEAIPEDYRRDEVGTDLYILDFRKEGDRWRTELRRTVLRNFFAAVQNGMLEVRIGADDVDVINRDTLLDILRDEIGGNL